MNTVEKILLHAKEEFLKYGFKDSSLRNIATSAGVTTGAIYACFKDKNHLFEVVVEPVSSKIEGFSSLIHPITMRVLC